MTLRLGFVGCGKWARKLAASFRACGAEIVCHDRGTNYVGMAPPPGYELSALPGNPLVLPGFGVRMPWRDQLAAKSIDAIVSAATPEVTTEVALACASHGKPVMATKPLFQHPETIRSVFYVDLWRLHSEAHVAMLEGNSDEVEFTLTGSGPFRSFPGAYDYGPHVMAAMLHLGLNYQSHEKLESKGDGELYSCMFTNDEGTEFLGQFGNGDATGYRWIWGQEETTTHIGEQLKSDVLQDFCQSFLNDVTESYVSTHLLDYSREGMSLLRKIRGET